MKRQTFPRKFADEPKQIIPLALRPPALTVKQPPAAGWRRLLFASVVLPALLVRGSFNLGQRLAFTSHGIAAAVKSSVVPTPAPVSLDLPSPVGPDNS
jgi:hypothetical protein